MGKSERYEIVIRLAVEEEDRDPRDPTGLTNAAFERLVDAIGSSGLGWLGVEKA